jgi:hypothetical protein
MVRQRLRLRRSVFVLLGDALLVVLALLLIWYGLMAMLLGLKASPDTVNSISAYRTVYDFFAGLEPGDITTTVRIIVGLAGFAAFLLCGWLAWKLMPRPYLARSEVMLEDDTRGVVELRPRAIERMVEVAAAANPAVTSATARFATDDVDVDIGVGRASDLPGTLRDTQRRAIESLERHDVPVIPVNVTLADYQPKTRRELR